MKRILCICTLTVISQIATAKDWPCWRGPDRTNVTSEPLTVPTLEDPVVWKINVGKGHSAVITQGDYVYTQGMVQTMTNDDTLTKSQILCIEAATGHIQWSHQFEITNQRFIKHFSGPGATPLWDDGRIYAQGREGHLFCLNAKTGKVIWQKHLVNDKWGKQPNWGFCASPVVDGNRLFINTGECGLALNKKTGAVIWKSDFGEGHMATPMVFQLEGEKRLLLVSKEALNILNPENGAVLDQYDWSSSTDPVQCKDGFILSGGISRIRIDKSSIASLWKNDDVHGSFQTGLVIKDRYFTVTNNRGRQHRFASLNTDTGALLWKEDLGENGSFMASGHRLIYLTGHGKLILADFNDQGIKPIYQKQVLTLAERKTNDNMAWDNIWTAPVLSNGRIYCRTIYGELACVKIN